MLQTCLGDYSSVKSWNYFSKDFFKKKKKGCNYEFTKILYTYVYILISQWLSKKYTLINNIGEKFTNISY